MNIPSPPKEFMAGGANGRVGFLFVQAKKPEGEEAEELKAQEVGPEALEEERPWIDPEEEKHKEKPGAMGFLVFFSFLGFLESTGSFVISEVPCWHFHFWWLAACS